MTLERGLRGVAGALILVSLALFRLHSPYWLILTALVAFSLFQSAFTDWCPMMLVLKKFGLR